MATLWILSLGKWRYLITGIALAVLFGMICRAAGKLLSHFSKRICFTGTCTAAAAHEQQTAVAVQFTDGSRLTHTAAFRTSAPEAALLHPGDKAVVAIRTEIFASGEYPETLADARANGDILLRSEYRKMLAAALLRELLVQLICCGIAFAVFLIAMHTCFPAH